MFRDTIGTAELAIPRFGKHIMWNVQRFVGRIAAKRNADTMTVPDLKRLYFAFPRDPDSGQAFSQTLAANDEIDRPFFDEDAA